MRILNYLTLFVSDILGQIFYLVAIFLALSFWHLMVLVTNLCFASSTHCDLFCFSFDSCCWCLVCMVFGIWFWILTLFFNLRHFFLNCLFLSPIADIAFCLLFMWVPQACFIRFIIWWLLSPSVRYLSDVLAVISIQHPAVSRFVCFHLLVQDVLPGS